MNVTYRTWREPADWAAIATVMAEESAADRLDYVPSAADLAAERKPNMEPARDVLLAEADGEVVGFAIGSWAIREDVLSLDTEGAVRPAVRRRRIGSELLRRTQEHLAERTRDVDRERKRIFSSWIADSQSGARALFEGDGYTAVRFGFEMIRRGLEEIPEAPTPDGLEIRRGSVADIRAILDAEEEAFRDHPGHREWTEADRTGILERPHFEPDLWRVAWDGDEIAGVVENWVHAEENRALGVNRGWLERVSVRRPWRQRGVARALIAESFRALRDRGIADACLGVDANNPSGALRLYESMGFEKMLSGRMYVRDAPR